jgi:GWxTD domain-containing protein
MKRYVRSAVCIVVLCHIIVCRISEAQTRDSSKSIVFSEKKNPDDAKLKESHLDGIASLGIGTYNGFRSDGHYASFLQPNVGFEFLAEPAGSLHLLLGGHIGISNPVTTGFQLGIREPIRVSKNPDLKIFTDLGILFFDDASLTGPIKYGARLAFGARTTGVVNIEYRLAGEWRGTSSDSIDGNRTRQLWWIGAEVGIALSLSGESRAISRKDSLRTSLRYIAAGEELDEFDAITSDAKLDDWLDRFWRIRDLTPDTKINEARIEYEKRVEAANRMFSHGRKLGISTDLGRVYAIYGQPDIIEPQYPIYSNYSGYILWVYSGRIAGTSFGVFLFEADFNEWRQIYSSVPGELSGPVPIDLPPLMMRWIQ